MNLERVWPHIRSRISAKFVAKLTLGLLLLLHFLKISKILPLDVLVDQNPLVTVTHSSIYADVLRDRAMLKQSSQAWGYDPTINAGRLAGIPFSEESRPWIVFDRFFRKFLSPAQSQKSFFFLVLLLSPFGLYLAGRQIGLARGDCVLAMAFNLILFARYEPTSWMMIHNGTIGSLLGAFTAMPVIGCLHRALLRNNLRRWGLFCGALASLLLFHPPSLLLLIGPVFFLILTSPAKNSRMWFYFCGSLAVALALNWFWIGPRLAHPEIIVPRPPRPSFSYFLSLYIPFDLSRYQLEPTLVVGYVFLLGLFGLLLWISKKEKSGWLFISALVPAVWLASGAPGASFFVPLRLDRFLTAVVVFQLLPAGAALKYLVGPTDILIKIAVGWLLWFGLTAPISLNRTLPGPRTEDLLRDNFLYSRLGRLPKTGRILWEDSMHQFRVVESLPFLTGHHFLGVANPYLDESQQWETAFFRKDIDTPAMLFGKQLATTSRESLVKMLEQYNVTHVVVGSLQARSRFDRYDADFEPVELYKSKWSLPVERWFEHNPHRPRERFRVYRVKSYQPSYFLKGSGQLKAGLNSLRLEDIGREETVIKFNWSKSLVAFPEDAVLRPYFIPPNPLPFIAISNPSNHPVVEITAPTKTTNNQ